MKKLNFKKLISGLIVTAMAITMLPTLQVSAKETTTVTANASNSSTVNVVAKNNRHGSTVKQDPNAFVTTWNMTEGEFVLPVNCGDGFENTYYIYDCMVDWGDGSTPTHLIGYEDYKKNQNNPLRRHTYKTVGTYHISITGTFGGGFCINWDDSTRLKLIQVNQWGNVNFSSMYHCFAGCNSLVKIPNTPITGVENCTTMQSLFQDCSLTIIPDALFKNCTGLIDARFAFDNNKLSTTGNDTFKDLHKLQYAVDCFYDCPLIKIGDSVFENCTSLEDYYFFSPMNDLLQSIGNNVFKNCTSMKIAYWFGSCKNLKTVGNSVWENCTSITMTSGIFNMCENLETIGDYLFKNCANMEFVATFYDCNLKSIPAHIFEGCTNTTKFDDTFCDNRNLTSIPDGLFDDCINVTDFGYCFESCTSLSGDAPELWTICPKSNGNLCSLGCTGLSNYSSIPDDWKK